MKKQLILAFVCLAGWAQAQDIEVKEKNASFSTGNHPALVVTIYENSGSDVLDKWKDRLKDFKNEKVKESGGEIVGDNIVIKDWGNNPVDIYSKVDEDKSAKKVTLMVAVDLGGTYLSESDQKDKYKYMEKLLKEFAVKTTKEPIMAAVAAATKLLGKMQDDQKDLEKDNKSLHGDIDDHKAKITKAENDIKKNEEDQAKKKAEIAAQAKVLEDIKKKMDLVK
jgi:hypothetical protein